MTNRSEKAGSGTNKEAARKRTSRRKTAKSSKTFIDVDGILDKPLPVKTPEGKRKMCAYEAGRRQMAEKAIRNKDIRLCRILLEEFKRFKVIDVRAPLPNGGVLVGPKGVDFQEWADEVTFTDPESGQTSIPDHVVRELVENEQ